MARIIVVTHAYDKFSERERFWHPPIGNYLLFHVLQAMRRRGHSWRVTTGLRPLRGDLAILHVDSTVVAPEYLALAAHYPITLNFAASDISKRRVSGALLVPGEDWGGPVIVKSDLNAEGNPETNHNLRAGQASRPPPHPDAIVTGEYYVLPTQAEVSPAVWQNPMLVVEKFLPELDPGGYALRSWVFMGSAERCTRRVSPYPVVKAHQCSTPTAVDVPDALRAVRTRLGFDYGKFDFVIHQGTPIMLDANRTPGKPPATGAVGIARAEQLADGLETLLKRRAMHVSD